jgi:CBS domain-containing protein
MQLREIMTRAVEMIPPDATLQFAARRMETENVGFLPVVQGEVLVGVITDRDIAVRAVARGLNPEKTLVEDAMTREVVSLPENSELEDAADVMEQQKVRRLVVTGKDDNPVGVVSMDKLAASIGRFWMDEEGRATAAIQGGFEGEAVAANREFPAGFDPAAQAEGQETNTAIGADPSVTTEAEVVGRDARDQSDPRTGPRELMEKDVTRKHVTK